MPNNEIRRKVAEKGTPERFLQKETKETKEAWLQIGMPSHEMRPAATAQTMSVGAAEAASAAAL